MAPGEGSPPDAFLAAYEAAQALAARLPKSPPRPSTAALLAQVRESCGLPACGLPASGPGVPRVLFWGGEGGRGRARSGDAGAAARLVRPRERAGSFLRRRRACTPNAAAAPRCDGTARPPSPRQPALAPKFAPRRPADALAARGAREVGNKTALFALHSAPPGAAPTTPRGARAPRSHLEVPDGELLERAPAEVAVAQRAAARVDLPGAALLHAHAPLAHRLEHVEARRLVGLGDARGPQREQRRAQLGGERVRPRRLRRGPRPHGHRGGQASARAVLGVLHITRFAYDIARCGQGRFVERFVEPGCPNPTSR